MMVSVQTIPAKYDINKGESIGNMINSLVVACALDVATDCLQVCVRMGVAQVQRATQPHPEQLK